MYPIPQYNSLVNGEPLTLNYAYFQADDGVTLAYQHIVKPGSERPTIMLIHGLGSSGADWELQIPELSKEFNLLIPDLRGFGASKAAYYAQNNKRLSIDAFANDCLLLLDQLGIFTCPVLGYSMGGAVALQMAANHLDIASSMNPICPSKLIILNSLPSFEMDTLKKKYQGLLRLGLNKIFSLERLITFILKEQYQTQPHLRNGIIEHYASTDKKVYTAALKALLGWHVREALPKIMQETLFVTADQDYSPVSDKEKFAGMMSNASVSVIKDSMHGTPFDQPDALNKVVISFFK